MPPDDEQEMWDDMTSIQALAVQGSDTSRKKVGELRDLHIRIIAITRHWINEKKLTKRAEASNER